MHDSARIIEIARSWIGTPYRHQESCKGVGTDCLGLVRGIWREYVGPEPEALPAYTPDWAERPGGGVLAETLAEAARRHLIEIAPDDAQPGDVLLFRMRARGPAKHASVLSASERMIHAYSGRAVVETTLTSAWRARIAFSFRFPGLDK